MLRQHAMDPRLRGNDIVKETVCLESTIFPSL